MGDKKKNTSHMIRRLEKHFAYVQHDEFKKLGLDKESKTLLQLVYDEKKQRITPRYVTNDRLIRAMYRVVAHKLWVDKRGMSSTLLGILHKSMDVKQVSAHYSNLLFVKLTKYTNYFTDQSYTHAHIGNNLPLYTNLALRANRKDLISNVNINSKKTSDILLPTPALNLLTRIIGFPLNNLITIPILLETNTLGLHKRHRVAIVIEHSNKKAVIRFYDPWGHKESIAVSHGMGNFVHVVRVYLEQQFNVETVVRTGIMSRGIQLFSDDRVGMCSLFTGFWLYIFVMCTLTVNIGKSNYVFVDDVLDINEITAISFKNEDPNIIYTEIMTFTYKLIMDFIKSDRNVYAFSLPRVIEYAKYFLASDSKDSQETLNERAKKLLTTVENTIEFNQWRIKQRELLKHWSSNTPVNMNKIRWLMNRENSEMKGQVIAPPGGLVVPI